MSYLVLPAGMPAFSKAVISLWFRVPKASITKVVETSAAEPAAPFYVLPYTIPLLTFGKPQTKKFYERLAQDVAVWHFTPEFPKPIIGAPGYSSTAEYPVDPSYIGLYCLGGRARLVFNIQMQDSEPIHGFQADRSRVDVHNYSTAPSDVLTLLATPGSGWTIFDGLPVFTTIVDVSYVQNAQPEFFIVETSHEIEPDRWHHLLLSFDIGGSLTVGHPVPSSACQLWYAIDDVDYRGQENLQPYRDADDGLGPNTILTDNIYNISGRPSTPSLAQNVPFGPPTGDYTPGLIPSNDAELGVPASTGFVDHVYNVELAELQIFTGITLDTGVVLNRRAFVDADGKPVNPETGALFLKRKPVVLLHGTGNWKSGRNTGSLGIDNKGEVIPTGQFKRTGVIDQYKPDPSLHGAQGRAAAPVQLTRARPERFGNAGL